MSRRRRPASPWGAPASSATVLRADFESDCYACDGRIVLGTPVTQQRGHWIHASCASGGDDL